MNRQHRKPPRQHGVALLLLLLIIGLGVSVLLISSFTNGQKSLAEQHTLGQLVEAREALLGFAAKNGRLPRPARSANDGIENPLPCEAYTDCTGLIPWVTLGILGKDSWGNQIRYSVTPAFTAIAVQSMISGGDKVIVSRDQNGEFFFLAGRDGCPLYVECPPAVLYSSAKNHPHANTRDFAKKTVIQNYPDELQNEFTTNRFVSRARNTDPNFPGGEFDDLVTWVPMHALQQRIKAAQIIK